MERERELEIVCTQYLWKSSCAGRVCEAESEAKSGLVGSGADLKLGGRPPFAPDRSRERAHNLSLSTSYSRECSARRGRAAVTRERAAGHKDNSLVSTSVRRGLCRSIEYDMSEREKEYLEW